MTTTFEVPPDTFESTTRKRFEEWLPSLFADPERHARFVNTLSMLEHIGSAKIARTQSGVDITATVLEHLAEETRHAHYLKQLARKVHPHVGDRYEDEWVLAGSSARLYFARLDAGSRRFARTNLSRHRWKAGTYLLVSWLVERRAMWLYPVYQRNLQALGRGFSVRSIISEETEHLAEMTEGLAQLGLIDDPALPSLVRFEERLFGRLADAMMGR